jgi:hypothetical protein
VILDLKIKNEYEETKYFFCVFAIRIKNRVGEIITKKIVSFYDLFFHSKNYIVMEG